MTTPIEPQVKPQAPSIRHVFCRWIYSFLLSVLLPILLIVFRKKLHHQHEKLRTRRFVERFGILPKHFKPYGIHIHCVSVGEINAAKGLIDNLLVAYPHLPITITTSSVTGAVHASTVYQDRVQHCYLPIDLSVFMRSFYGKLKPIMSVVTEVEVWPNMVNECYKRDVSLIMINGRMTTRSLQNYKRVSWLFRGTLRQFALICAQNTESFDNFLAYGVYKRKLKLSRNMKFDLLPDDKDEALGEHMRKVYQLSEQPILVAASTHDPEEKLLLDMYKRLKQDISDLVLIIVPRHPHRFDEVYQLVKANGYSTQRVSDLKEGGAQIDNGLAKTECIVVDKMGWLKACYSICSAAFIGGSFAPKGGHNALECALYAKPMVMGPSIFNNPSICQHLAEQNALIIVDTPNTLYESLTYWLSNTEHAKLDGERGLKVLMRNAGAVEYTFSALRPFLPPSTH